MKVVLHSEEDLEFTEFDTPGLELEAEDSGAQFSALQMFATSLAMCTFSILMAYAERAGADPASLTMRLRWSYGEDPMRIAHMDMDIHWPDLPESRLRAAERVAARCTLHNTLEHPPEVVTRVSS
ncbi:MAG TPA: OsmC family protein [Gammaproteobacteria bacterium]|nr:OsmC family protein [Gammaproteobacteria bacterium]